jgi:hypothetical protein
VLLGDISILIPLGVLSHTADSVGIAYMHEAGGSSQGRHSSIPSSRLPHLAVWNTALGLSLAQRNLLLDP